MKKIFIISILILFALQSSLFSQQIQFNEKADYLNGFHTSVFDFDFDEENNQLYACGGRNTIMIFDLNTNLSLFTIGQDSPEFSINHISVNYDNTMMAYAGYNSEKVIICDPVSLKNIVEIEGFTSVLDLCFSPTKNQIAIIAVDKINKESVYLYNAETGELIFDFMKNYWGKATPINIDFSADGNTLACGICNFEHGVWVWDCNTADKLLTIKHTDDINIVNFSHNSKYIAGGSSDSNIYIWNLETSELTYTLVGSKGMLTCLDYSNDDKYIIGGGLDYSSSFKVWDIEKQEMIQSVGERTSVINCLKFAPDGKSVLVAYTTYGDLFNSPTISVYKVK